MFLKVGYLQFHFTSGRKWISARTCRICWRICVDLEIFTQCLRAVVRLTKRSIVTAILISRFMCNSPYSLPIFFIRFTTLVLHWMCRKLCWVFESFVRMWAMNTLSPHFLRTWTKLCFYFPHLFSSLGWIRYKKYEYNASEHLWVSLDRSRKACNFRIGVHEVTFKRAPFWAQKTP